MKKLRVSKQNLLKKIVDEFSEKGKVLLTHNKKKFKNIGPLKNINNI